MVNFGVLVKIIRWNKAHPELPPIDLLTGYRVWKAVEKFVRICPTTPTFDEKDITILESRIDQETIEKILVIFIEMDLLRLWVKWECPHRYDLARIGRGELSGWSARYATRVADLPMMIPCMCGETHEWKSDDTSVVFSVKEKQTDEDREDSDF